MSPGDRLSIRIYDAGEAPRDETPDQHLLRLHEGEERALRLLACDAPEPSAGFDERFADRLAALRLIERSELSEAEDPGEDVTSAAALDPLLAAYRPEPGPGFDDAFQFRLRRALADDGALRVPEPDALRAPALPIRSSPLLDRPRSSRPFTPRRIGVAAAVAAASIAVSAWFMLSPGSGGDAVEDLRPDDLEMVAHLDLLENYGEVEAFEALRDEEVFEVVASLDVLSRGEDGQDPDNEVKFQ